MLTFSLPHSNYFAFFLPIWGTKPSFFLASKIVLLLLPEVFPCNRHTCNWSEITPPASHSTDHFRRHSSWRFLSFTSQLVSHPLKGSTACFVMTFFCLAHGSPPPEPSEFNTQSADIVFGHRRFIYFCTLSLFCCTGMALLCSFSS